MDVRPRSLIVFETADGRAPFSEWLQRLRDIKARAIIRARLERVRLGNLGNCRPVGQGVQELKIDFGPGYRVYFSEADAVVVVLLCGGDKSTQDRDILMAHQLWADCKRRSHGENR